MPKTATATRGTGSELIWKTSPRRPVWSRWSAPLAATPLEAQNPEDGGRGTIGRQRSSPGEWGGGLATVGISRQSWQASGGGWVTLAPCLQSLVGGRSTRCLAARSSGGRRLRGEADGADLGEEKQRISRREAPWERESSAVTVTSTTKSRACLCLVVMGLRLWADGGLEMKLLGLVGWNGAFGSDGLKWILVSIELMCPVSTYQMHMASPRRTPYAPRRLEGGLSPRLALSP
jgi:hypothetical protein